MNLLNEKQVSKMISKSVSWLQRKRWEGNSIPYRKIGHSVRYDENAVMRWLQENAKTFTSTSQYHQNNEEEGVYAE